jgi:hypothetical protein
MPTDPTELPFRDFAPKPHPTGPAEFKSKCRVDDRWEGLVHVVVGVYDATFHPWWGRLDVACKLSQVDELIGVDLTVTLDDGRSAFVRAVRLYDHADPPEFGGLGSPHVAVDFVGLGNMTEPTSRQ